MKRLYALLVAAALCFPSIGAQAWWQSIEQVAISGVAPPTPDVDLNFAAGTYSPGTLGSMTSVTNSTGGYVTNSNGSITLVAANTPRIGTGTGLLVEEARTNSYLQSQAFSNSSWTKTNVTATDNVIASPDGTTDAATLIGTVTNGIHVVQQNVNLSIVTQTYSFYVKPNGYNFAYILVSDNSTDVMKGFYDLSAGAVLGVSPGVAWSNVSATITPASNGFYRITLTGTDCCTVGQYTSQLGINATNSQTAQSFAGDGVSGIDAYGAQAEFGNTFATSYIRATTAAVTRSADNVSAAGALATLLARTTATAEAKTNSSQQSIAATLIDANGSILLGKTSGNVGTTTVGATLSTGNTGTWTGADDLSLAWSPSGGSILLNGGAAATDATARTPSATFHLGSTSGSSAFFNGYLTRVEGFNAGPSGGRTCTDDTASTNFLARTSALSNAQKDRVCNLIQALETGGIITGNLSGAAGCGSVLDGLYFTVTNTTTTANLNICGTSFGLTSTSLPTFTADAGYVGNGTSNYLDPNYNPSTQGVNFTANSNSMGVYLGNARGPLSSATDVGFGDGTNFSYLNAYDTSNAGFQLNVEMNGTAFPGFVLPSGTPKGFTTLTRTSSTSISAYKNNSATVLSPGPISDPVTALPNSKLVFLAFTTSGTPNSFAPDTFYGGYFGKGLTGAQHLAIANAFNGALTPLGLNAF